MAEYEKDKRKAKYKPSGRAASGKPLYKSMTVQQLKDSIRSERRGFDIEINLTNKQAKKYSSLIEKARSSGVEVTAMKKKDFLKSGFSYKAIGGTNVAGGFAQTKDKTGEYRGKAAQAMFEQYGGKITPMKQGDPLSGKITLPRPGKNIGGLRLAPSYFGLFNRVKPQILGKKKKKFGDE
jgi:hypothetical protein